MRHLVQYMNDAQISALLPLAFSRRCLPGTCPGSFIMHYMPEVDYIGKVACHVQGMASSYLGLAMVLCHAACLLMIVPLCSRQLHLLIVYL